MSSRSGGRVLPNDHVVLCGKTSLTSRLKHWRDAKPHNLRIGPQKTDVHIKIEHITQKMADHLSPRALDLLEIAVYVYVADQLISRGGLKEFEYGDAWRRRIRFEIPVREPDFWNTPAILQLLRDTLLFLSDDKCYEFQFSKLKNPPPAQKYLFADAQCPSDFEEVILFSGGLDSLGGAVQEIIAGQRKVVLVSHRPVNTLYSRQKALVKALAGKLKNPGLAPLHVPVQINKGRELRGESTQRLRSFLFASLGAIVANSLELDRIRFYENGIMSLNLPISPQLNGGRATRTTHPFVLHHFEKLFSQVLERTFSVENPFLWKTKADVWQVIKQSDCSDLCAQSNSCTHTREFTKAHSHCGRCSQCIDRWLTGRAAGVDSTADPAENYAMDVFLGERSKTELMLAERYVGFAREVDRLDSPTAFAERLGEASRHLKHLGMPTTQAVEETFKLYRRHAKQILDALARITKENAEQLVRIDFPVKSLLGVTAGVNRTSAEDTPANADATPPASEKPRVDHDTFTVHFRGKECELRNTVAFHLFDYLWKHSTRNCPINELINEVWNGALIEKNTVQRTASSLRRELREAGIDGIVIDGKTNKGHYRLKIAG